MTNNLAYCGPEFIMTVEIFMILAPGANVIELSLSVIYEFSYQARLVITANFSSLV